MNKSQADPTSQIKSFLILLLNAVEILGNGKE